MLVGEWSASTSQSGPLELTLATDGTFHHYNGSSMDLRGKAVVQGAKITFHNSDGTTNTDDWSVSGGTLTLADITYLKGNEGAGGVLALTGTWTGLDDIFETLVFEESGRFERRHDAEGTLPGKFRVEGHSLTLEPEGGAAVTVTWTVTNGILTLQVNAGTTAQYSRSS